MPADVAHAHPPRVERDDLVVEPVEPRLALGNQARLEAALPVARHRDLQQALLDPQRLAAHAVAPVRLHGRRLLPVLVAEMLGQLGPEHALHQRRLQVPHQPAVAQQILRPLAALQKLVQ
jgi:hypothetical protein